MASFFARLGQKEPDPPFTLYQVSVVLAVSVALFIVLTVMVSLLTSQINTLLIFNLACIAIIAFVWLRYRKERNALRLTLATPAQIPLALLLAIGVAILLDLLTLALLGENALPSTALSNMALLVTHDRAGILDWLMAAAFVVALQPAAEGLALRGVTFPTLRYRFGTWAGLVVTIALQGLFQWLVYSSGRNDPAGTWYALILPLLQGVYIVGVRAYTGSTLWSIIAQAGIGLFALSKLFLLVG